MTNRFFTPNAQFIDTLGNPYAGGFLYFYVTGTSTPLDTYSNQALTIANLNPVVLDADGCAGSIFLQNLAYKVKLLDVNLNEIWTYDPVYSSDYSTYAAFRPYNGNPNGFVAGTAGTVGTLPGTSVVWDYVNSVLYVATTTGNAATTVWSSVNSSSTTTVTPPPQGYLTLSSDSSNPILTADSVAATAVYYTPYVGNLVPVYNGSTFVTTSFTQLTLTLSASHALSTIYDVFVFSNSGVLTLVTGPAWSSSAAGSGARGTGAGTTQLQRLNGLWVNAVQISGRNGATTYVVPANTATYLGSIFINTVAGQISCLSSYGQSRKWGVWNAYNRQPVYMKGGNSSAVSWNYFTATVRAAGADAANCITSFVGLPECQIRVTYQDSISMNTTASTAGGATIGIGVNSTVAFSGTTAQYALTTSGVGFSSTQTGVGVANATIQPGIGITVITALEAGNGVSNTNTFYGTESYMLLTTVYPA